MLTEYFKFQLVKQKSMLISLEVTPCSCHVHFQRNDSKHLNDFLRSLTFCALSMSLRAIVV